MKEELSVGHELLEEGRKWQTVPEQEKRRDGKQVLF